MQESNLRQFQSSTEPQTLTEAAELQPQEETPLFVGSCHPEMYAADDNGNLFRMGGDGKAYYVEESEGGSTEYIERGRIPLDAEFAGVAPLTDDERAQVFEGAPAVTEIAPGIELHGTATDAGGRAITGPTGDTLPEQTLINGQAAVVRAREGQEPPAGYVQVNRKQRRQMSVNIRKAAIKQGKRRKAVKVPGGARASQSAMALSACSGYRTIMESGID